jgi:hypothetical protein
VCSSDLANGHGELNQNYLEENGYSATNLENIQSTNAVTRNAAIQRMTVLQTNLKDNARVATILVKPSYSPPPKSELEQLEGFITEFDSRKSKNIWLQRLDRIFQPEVYASYDKALEAAKELRAAKNRTLGWHNLTKLPANIAGLAYDLILSDIVKNIKKIRQGYSGKQKLDAGIDYNSTFTNQLAQYKTDLEAAGGKFNIDASGNFTVETPPEKKEKKAALTTTRIITTETFKELKTNTNAASNPGTTGTILYTNLRMAADFDKVRNNQAAITGLVNNANETARQQNNIASMQNLQKTLEEQAIAERTQAYNMFIQQNKQLAGKSIMLIMPLFYTAYPKFAPKGFSNPAQKTR